MSGLAGLSRGTRVPICPDTICVPWDRDRDRSLRDERDRDRFSRDCPAWLSRGTSGTGTKNRGTVPSRPLPIPGQGNFRNGPALKFNGKNSFPEKAFFKSCFDYWTFKKPLKGLDFLPKLLLILIIGFGFSIFQTGIFSLWKLENTWVDFSRSKFGSWNSLGNELFRTA